MNGAIIIGRRWHVPVVTIARKIIHIAAGESWNYDRDQA